MGFLPEIESVFWQLNTTFDGRSEEADLAYQSLNEQKEQLERKVTALSKKLGEATSTAVAATRMMGRRFNRFGR